MRPAVHLSERSGAEQRDLQNSTERLRSERIGSDRIGSGAFCSCSDMSDWQAPLVSSHYLLARRPPGHCLAGARERGPPLLCRRGAARRRPVPLCSSAPVRSAPLRSGPVRSLTVFLSCRPRSAVPDPFATRREHHSTPHRTSDSRNGRSDSSPPAGRTAPLRSQIPGIARPLKKNEQLLRNSQSAFRLSLFAIF